MTNGHALRPRPRAETVVFFAFIAGAAASPALELAPPPALIASAAPLVLLLAPSLSGLYLIPVICAAAGLLTASCIAHGGLVCLPSMCLLVPLVFIAARSGMELSARVRQCCLSSPKYGAGLNRNNVLLYLSAAGSLISAYFILNQT